MSEDELCSDTGARIKRALTIDLAECPLSRAEVAERLGARLHRTVTLAQIDAFTAPTKPHRFPAEWIPSWCAVLGSRRVLEIVCSEAGLWLADPCERELAEYGRAVIEQQRIGEKIRRLQERLA